MYVEDKSMSFPSPEPGTEKIKAGGGRVGRRARGGAGRGESLGRRKERGERRGGKNPRGRGER